MALMCDSARIAALGKPRFGSAQKGRASMSLGTILLIVLVLILVGVFPAWPHSSSWGYGPVGGVGLLVIILIVLLVMGRI